MAQRAGIISQQTHQHVVGVVENMSWLETPDGTRLEVFGSGGGEEVSRVLSAGLGHPVPLLAQIPLEQRLREAGDAGVPVVLAAPESEAATALRRVADHLVSRQRGLAGRSLGISPR